MIEISLNHAELVMWPFYQDVAEHYGYYDELFGMNLNDPADAEVAIGRWLMPTVSGWSKKGFYLRKEACRVCISQNLAFSSYWLPGIEDAWKSGGNFEDYHRDVQIFQRKVWKMLFGEVYEERPLDLYVQRVDASFVDFPDSEEDWGEAVYAPWSDKYK